MGTKILGIENRVNTEKGTKCCILHIKTDHDDYSIENGAVGMRAENIYLRGTHIPTDYLGRDVELVYKKGFKGQAEVSSINLIDKK